MKIERQKPLVEDFRYELLGKRHGEVIFDFNVEPLEVTEKIFGPEIGNPFKVTFIFQLLINQIVISGKFSQVVGLEGRYIHKTSDFRHGEVNEVLEPLLELLKHLTYETSEIALDEPGINLNFEG